jgi:hypothetical protein
MKKVYLTPEAVTIDMRTVKMLAASREEIPIKPGQGGAAGTTSARGEWGNLWKR